MHFQSRDQGLLTRLNLVEPIQRIYIFFVTKFYTEKKKVREQIEADYEKDRKKKKRKENRRSTHTCELKKIWMFIDKDSIKRRNAKDTRRRWKEKNIERNIPTSAHSSLRSVRLHGEERRKRDVSTEGAIMCRCVGGCQWALGRCVRLLPLLQSVIYKQILCKMYL